MSQREPPSRRRPERVVILDADDPMVEIHGEIVWREEHDRIVDEVSRLAFADGYAAGHRDSLAATQSQQPILIQIARRRSIFGWVRLVVLAGGLLMLLLLTLPLVVNSLK
jgi:hypothetical protein